MEVAEREGKNIPPGPQQDQPIYKYEIHPALCFTNVPEGSLLCNTGRGCVPSTWLQILSLISVKTFNAVPSKCNIHGWPIVHRTLYFWLGSGGLLSTDAWAQAAC